MSEEQFAVKMQAVLTMLPAEFRDFVSEESWDRGHSAGYEEVVNIAENLAYNLEKTVRAYNKRLGILEC